MTTPTLRSPTSAPAGPASLTAAGLITLLLGAALPIVDFFIVNVALPTIDRTLNASATMLELVVAGYGIAYGVMLVLGGRLGDTYGRKRLFKIGLVAFTLTSLACGLAPTAGVLVGARIAQGAAAAMMLPQVLSTIQATTTGDRRSRALGMYGANGGMAMVLGQLLGGVLIAADIAGTSWRPIFLVNVPIGLLGLAMARRVPETRSPNPATLDLPGTALLGAGLFTLLVPLTEGRAVGWPLWTWLLLAASPILFAALVVVERRVERAGRVALLPPSVLRMPSIKRGLLLCGPFFMGFGAYMFVAAVTFQDGLRYGPFAAGLAVAPMAVTFLVASLVSSRLVARYGRSVVTVGAAIQGTGVFLAMVTVLVAWPDVTVLTIAPAMAVTGFGQGLMVTTLFRVTLSKVPAESAGVGSGSLVTVQQASLALGVATLGSLFLWLSEPDVLGMRNAFAIVMAVQVVIAAAVSLFGRRLPDPR
ncbi:MFS transporter [Kibdelosporangium phytohabitans]|uniref:MFS transporter n=1 Tax=Kibdelosporangium phytohabitans TaxID=860235 RepID=A0A0N9IDZ3_9PSEU|nr:MFS transporter [Kibdelosporangium phytohabitans]ALG14666.1 MFS transporter [Kibdelosporangium phytohabitans]MBE1468463.1 MFS family permease [Kibdelosporangium phytohabitans]